MGLTDGALSLRLMKSQPKKRNIVLAVSACGVGAQNVVENTH